METQQAHRGRSDYFDKNRFLLAEPDQASERFDGDDPAPETRRLVDYIEGETEQLVPIISNSFRTDWILDYDFNSRIGAMNSGTDVETPELSYIEQQFAQFWASTFSDGFPFGIPSLPKSISNLAKDFPEIQRATEDELATPLLELIRAYERASHSIRRVAEYNHLARVAQYRQIIPERDEIDPDLDDIRTLANREYLEFLKKTLYNIARSDNAISSSLHREVGNLIGEYTFSDLAQEFGYPRFNEEYPDLLRIIAKLPLPIYITTSYFDFLERLLQAEGKEPRTQICFYRDRLPTNILPEHATRDLVPSVTKPVVFHLFGYEKYPSSLVLSEGDYLEFLTAMATDHNTAARKVPLYIRDALSDSAILILGYRLLNWDFRIVFRSLFLREGQVHRKYKVALHLDPKFDEAIQDNVRALRYIKQYFKSAGFSLAVSNTVEFVEALWNEWTRRQS